MDRRVALRLIGSSAAALAGGTYFGSRIAGADSPGILTRRIPSSGEMLPAIGLGTWQVFDVGSGVAARNPLKDVLAAFVSMGGKLIDSSPMYGRSEQVVGDLMTELGFRSKLFVATKVWTSGKARGISQMEDSMRKLRADPIDLMQVHNLTDVKTQLATLEEWKRSGRVRTIGITHYTSSHHDDLARVISSEAVDFVQVNYSVAERDAERKLLPLAQERNVAVIANRPFAGGDLLSRLKKKPLPGWASEIDCESWAQILLKFIVSHPAITCAIPATSKVAHMRDNMRAGFGRLPEAKLRERIAAEID